MTYAMAVYASTVFITREMLVALWGKPEACCPVMVDHWTCRLYNMSHVLCWYTVNRMTFKLYKWPRVYPSVALAVLSSLQELSIT